MNVEIVLFCGLLIKHSKGSTTRKSELQQAMNVHANITVKKVPTCYIKTKLQGHFCDWQALCMQTTTGRLSK